MTAQAGPGRADIPRKCRRCPAGGSGRAAAIALRAPCSGIEIQESKQNKAPPRPATRDPRMFNRSDPCPSQCPNENTKIYHPNSTIAPAFSLRDPAVNRFGVHHGAAP